MFGQTELHGNQKMLKLDFTLQPGHVLKGYACVSRSLIHFVGYVALQHQLNQTFADRVCLTDLRQTS